MMNWKGYGRKEFKVLTGIYQEVPLQNPTLRVLVVEGGQYL
jgi:hypothetical protein